MKKTAIPRAGSGKVEDKGNLEKPHPFQISLRLKLRNTPMNLQDRGAWT
jgi:hypothetical protein